MSADPATAPAMQVEQAGLLFVHGVGEQERWEHLRSSVVEVAQLLGAHCGKRASVSVVDGTQGGSGSGSGGGSGEWPHAPGEPDITSPAPITIALRQQEAGGCAIDFECHEVWWADLGKRSGLLESFGFWIWGLGQWGAPIYYELDASGLSLEKQSESSPVVRMPQSVAFELWPQFWARINLAWAAVVATLAALSISLFKQVAKLLAGATPSTTLIVDYVGDVQTYTERARPGRGPVSDPGHPWRVAIRRRMISEMVAMSARGYKRWYIFAHSLGSVVAFNGISELGHTLPNYLPQRLWDSLPANLKRDDEAAKRHDIEAMMPARPAWLAAAECLNRPLLFATLAGFVTYGSPLDKFAALWPRIVAAERYRGSRAKEDAPGRQVFSAGTSWVNILSQTDPIAGNIDRYTPAATGLDAGDLPRLTNLKRPRPQSFGVSHVEYFQVKERFEAGDYRDYYGMFFGWLTTGRVPPPPPPRRPEDAVGPWGRFTAEADEAGRVHAQALAVSLAIWAAAAVIVGLAVLAATPASWNLMPPAAPGSDGEVGRYLRYFGLSALGVAALVAACVYLCGAYRWLDDVLLNRRLAIHDAAQPDTPVAKRKRLERFVRLALWQKVAASLFLFVVPILIGCGLWAGGPWLPGRTGTLFAAAALVFAGAMALASWVQSRLTTWARSWALPDATSTNSL